MNIVKKRLLSLLFLGSLACGTCTMPAYGAFELRSRIESLFIPNFLSGLVVGVGSCLLMALLFGNRFRSVTRSLHCQRLLDVGVSEDILPYVKDARKVGNIRFIQFEAVDQFDPTIMAIVDTHQKQVIEQCKQASNVSDIDRLSSEQKEQIRSFDPRGTCVAQTIREARLIQEIVKTRSARTKKKYLGLINDTEAAKSFLQKEIRDNVSTSWLSGRNLEQRIALDRYGFTSNSVTVLEASSLILLNGPDHLKTILQRDTIGDFSHTFIICAGDAINLGSADTVFTETSSQYKFQNQLQASLLKSQLDTSMENEKHYYVVSIVKQGEDVFYYIIDTKSNNNHINDEYLKNRDQFICDKLLTNESVINLREETKKITKKNMEKVMSNMVLGGNLNFKKKVQ